MSDVTIESLELQVQSSASSAVSGIDALTTSLAKLRSAVKGGVGLTTVARQLTNFGTALNSIDSNAANKVDGLANALSKLQGVGRLKISSSIGNQLQNLDTVLRTIDDSSATKVDRLATSLSGLRALNGLTISSSIGNQLRSIGSAVGALNGADFSGISNLITALQPLNSVSASSGLRSIITQLQRLPALEATLNSINWATFTSQIRQLANALAPLATRLNTVATAFSRLPARISRLITLTGRLARTNNRASTSYINLWARIQMAFSAVRTAARMVSSWISESNDYVESLNLFTASMGKYADAAQEYAEQVGDILGIDPAEWMRNEGVFNTIIKGFGVVEDKAYSMSQNLTQLGYDISSFFNISVEDAMAKVSSGISGELEPLRRLGYDLSVARLQQDALNLGIEKSVSAMTQAEKAQLRYWEMMTQVTVVQGDMARTLDSPANQLRILKAQLTLVARALGNAFIPMLNKALPYVIAFAKVVRTAAEELANFMGFELPTVDYSSLNTDGITDITDALEEAEEATEKVKNSIMGFDELNLLNDNSDDDTDTGNGGDLGIELPTYDFLADAISKNVAEIESKLRDALEDIKGKLQEIMPWIAAIGAGLAAWTVGNLLRKLGLIPATMSQIAGAALAVAGAVLYILSYCDAWINGLDWNNFIGLLAGMAAVVIGLGLAFGSVGAAIGGIITGIPLLVLGIKDAFENGLNEINFGAMLIGAIVASISAARIGAALTPLINKLFGVTLPTKVGAAIGGGAVAAASGIALFVTGIYSALTEGLNWMNGLLIPFGSTLAGAGIGAIFGSAGGALGIVIGGLIGLAIGLITDGIIYLTQNWEQVSAWLSEKWAALTEWFVKKWGELTTFLAGIPGKVGEMVNKVVEWFASLPEKIGYNMGLALGQISRWGTDVKNYLSENVPIWISNIGQWFSELPGKIYTAISGAITSVEQWRVDMTNKIKEAVPKIINSIVDFFKEIPGKLADLGKSIWDGFDKGLKNAWHVITSAIGDFVKGFIKGFLEGFGIHSPSTVMMEIGLNLVYGLQNGLKSIGSVFSNIFSTIGSSIGNFGRSMYNWGSEMMGNLVTGINGGLRGLASKVASAANTIRSYLHFSQPDIGPLSDFNSWMPDMMSQLADGIAKDENLVRKQVARLASDMSLESTVQANVSAYNSAPTAATVGDNESGLISAVYTAMTSALASQNDNDDSGTPIIINIGNEQIASYMVKQNKRVALMSGGKA